MGDGAKSRRRQACGARWKIILESLERKLENMPSRRSSEVLSVRALNRALLKRQMLLDRRAAPVADTLEHLVGMQAQEPQAPYVGLWSRLDGFVAEDVSDLIAARRAVRGGLMRATIHLVTVRDWARLRPLVSPVLASAFKGSPFSKSIGGVDLSELLLHGRELLTDQPRSRAELGPLLAERWPGIDPTALAYAVSYLEPIVQVPPRGLWRQSGQARWMSAPAWLESDIDAQPSLEELVLRYLAAFGPASVQDVRAWSGLSGIAQIIDSQRDRLRSFRDSMGRELFDVLDGPLPDPDTPAPPRFLPPFDNAILSHADRVRIIPGECRDAVNRDRLMRTFLVDGFVAGTWRLEGPTLHVHRMRPLAHKELRAVIDEAERLIEFVANVDIARSVQVHQPGD
jgi:hypothetical protein